MTESYLPVLTVAGSDSSGGAGIQADIKTISALGCYAMSAITAVTVQNTLGVDDVEGIDPLIVEKQIDFTTSDIRPLAVKTGMLYSTDIIGRVVAALKRNRLANVVVDPVMISTSGAILLKGDNVVATVRSTLVPCADLLTPNVHEAAVLADSRDTQRQLSEIHSMGCANILLKGGDRSTLDNGVEVKTDILSLDWGKRIVTLTSPAVATRNTHGTGCTLSAAIASMLALGHDMEQAVTMAKQYISQAITEGSNVNIGHGHGPVNHFFDPHKLIKK